MTATNVTLRLAEPADAHALQRLAQRDCAKPMLLPAVLAEVQGVARAARSLQHDHSVADPFFPTEHLLDLLELHARALSAPSRPRRRPIASRRRAPARASVSTAPSPAH